VDGELLLETLKREGARRRAAATQQQAAQAVASALTAEEREALGDWADAIDAITDPADREVLDADVDEAERDGRLSAFRAGAVRKAIDIKVAEVAPRAAAA